MILTMIFIGVISDNAVFFSSPEPKEKAAPEKTLLGDDVWTRIGEIF